MSQSMLFGVGEEPKEACPLCSAPAKFVRNIPANQALFVCVGCRVMGELDFTFSVMTSKPKLDPRRL